LALRPCPVAPDNVAVKEDTGAGMTVGAAGPWARPAYGQPIECGGPGGGGVAGHLRADAEIARWDVWPVVSAEAWAWAAR
jgi:hypothetical protein